jgi:DNA-binding transcriptional MerR regulator
MTVSKTKTLPEKRYFRIGEVCELTQLKPHVLRYWETEFKQIKPHKTKSNQRLYRKKDIETLLLIKTLLYEQKYTIAGAKARLETGRKDKDRPPPERQLHLDFDPHDREQLLSLLISELQKLRDSLDNGPDQT